MVLTLKQLFSNSVNSPLKAPAQNSNKEGTPTATTNGRKSSISLMQNSGTAHNTNMPAGRSGPRRRETSDSLTFNNSLASPITAGKSLKDDLQGSTPSPSLIRRRTDFKDNALSTGLGEKFSDNEKIESALDTSSPFGSFKRTTTGPLSAAINGPSSPWSAAPQSAGFPSTGAFGNFSLGGATAQPPTPSDKKLGFGSFRGESRFKGLMSKGSSEDMSSRNKDRTPISNMEKLTEMESENSKAFPLRSFRQSTESNPFDELDHHVGSAALGGDIPSPAPQNALFLQGQADQPRPHDDIGFSTFGTASEMPSFRDMMQRHQYPLQQTTQSSQYTNLHTNEPMSPTNTNPYQSPEGEKSAPDDHDTDDSDAMNMHQSAYGLGAGSRQFNPAFEGAASDRSQTSSAGMSRGFPNLGGLGGLGGIGTAGAWSTAPVVVGTPSRANPGFSSGFTDSMFSSLGDTQSASYISNAAFSNSGSTQFGNIGTVGRGSKMGSLFPTAMQDQMRGNDMIRPEHGYTDGRENTQHNIARSGVGSNAPGFGSLARDTDSPSQQNRGMLDDLFGNLDGRGRGTQNLTSSFPAGDGSTGALSPGSASISAQAPNVTSSALPGLPSASASSSSAFGRSPETDNASGASSQMPATQQRQMVMPDRMRWIYRDPQGNTQGPWSGLEMHDWYKAGFFSPELQVRKQEDLDYEPLAQLIRRIGNSREPFLVPQIGIPHGPASTQPNNTPSVLGTVPAASPSVQTGSAQPPFASSFPSFGTTLTAEQQNALERRKQEEQYLMARQKEHLAQQQVLIKQMQHMQGGPHSIHAQQLHHHSSAHSLQSQPSYGSITSPTGYQLTPAQPPIQQHGTMPGFFDSQPRSSLLGMGPVGSVPENLHSGRDNEVAAAMERLNLGRAAQASFGNLTQNLVPQEGLSHQQQVATMFQDRARLQREQDHFDLLQRASLGEGQDTMSRFEQFNELRAQEEDPAQFYQSSTTTKPSQRQSTELKEQPLLQESANESRYDQEVKNHGLGQQTGSTMGVEQAPLIAGSQKHVPSVPTQSPWAIVEAGLPMPFPPPQSSSPLPAPAAQRNRQHVADALAAESRSRSQTPSVETPSAALAPWAKESLEGSKGPSLKEIQEAEARQTAQQEEIAAAERRALAEQERQNQAQSIVPTVGLPSSANWASGGSPATPTSAGPSAWAKPLAGKQSATTSATGTKKTLAQIQKEEEARKNRVAAAAAANTVNNLAGIPTLPGGKRYADLAGKNAAPIITGMTGAWTTVGAGGKLKTPVGSTSAPSPVPRNVSSGGAANASVVAKPKPVAGPVRSNTASGSSVSQSANDELYKWAKGALGKGLNSSINGVY